MFLLGRICSANIHQDVSGGSGSPCWLVVPTSCLTRWSDVRASVVLYPDAQKPAWSSSGSAEDAWFLCCDVRIRLEANKFRNRQRNHGGPTGEPVHTDLHDVMRRRSRDDDR